MLVQLYKENSPLLHQRKIIGFHCFPNKFAYVTNPSHELNNLCVLTTAESRVNIQPPPAWDGFRYCPFLGGDLIVVSSLFIM